MSYTNFHNVGGSFLNGIGGENFEKMQFDPPPPPPTIRHRRVNGIKKLLNYNLCDDVSIFAGGLEKI